MSTESPNLPVSRSPGLPFWLGGSLTAVTIAWVGAKLNASGAAPFALLPLGLGLALGIALVGLAAMTNKTCRKRLAAASIAFAILTIVAQHAWLYRDYRQQWWHERASEPRLAIFRTEDAPLLPAAYYAREIEYSPRRPLLWMVDAVLIVVATVGVVLVAHRRIGTNSA